MEKLGIYVQVPFCQTKCTYCNFHTGVVSTARFAPYVEAVCREIRTQGVLLNCGCHAAEGIGRSCGGHGLHWRGDAQPVGTSPPSEHSGYDSEKLRGGFCRGDVGS